MECHFGPIPEEEGGSFYYLLNRRKIFFLHKSLTLSESEKNLWIREIGDCQSFSFYI